MLSQRFSPPAPFRDPFKHSRAFLTLLALLLTLLLLSNSSMSRPTLAAPPAQTRLELCSWLPKSDDLGKLDTGSISGNCVAEYDYSYPGGHYRLQFMLIGEDTIAEAQKTLGVMKGWHPGIGGSFGEEGINDFEEVKNGDTTFRALVLMFRRGTCVVSMDSSIPSDQTVLIAQARKIASAIDASITKGCQEHTYATATTAPATPIILLPGVAATQLFDDMSTRLGGVMELWPLRESTLTGREYLALDKDGKSKIKGFERDIVIGDIIRRPGGECVGALPLRTCVKDYYSGMISFLQQQGYNENVNLFIFPYDWRMDNSTHFSRLDQVIDTALQKNPGSKKVFLVAHSMGGIISQAYVYSKPERAAKVEAFITMGTPYFGSPKVYYAMMNGYTFGNPTIAPEMMKILAQNYSAAYQLLPRKPFITDTSTNNKLSLDESYGIRYKWFKNHAYGYFWDDFTPTENNTQVLNSTLLAEAKQFQSLVMDQNNSPKPLPSGVKQYVIIGHGISTLSGYDLVDWKPGAIEVGPFKSSYLEQANGRKVVLHPKINEGDGTVPIWSLEISSATQTYYVPYKTGWVSDESSEHGSLAQNKTIQSIVGQIVKGNPPKPSDYPRPQFYMDEPTGQLKELEAAAQFELHSDAHLRIANDKGIALGFNEIGGIDEGLPGTFLSMDGIEYAAISDLNAAYKVQVNGLTDGKFTLGVQLKKDGKTIEATYPEVPVKKGTLAQFDLNPNQSITTLPTMQVTTDGQTTRVTATIKSTTPQLPGLGVPGINSNSMALVLSGGLLCATFGVLFIAGMIVVTRPRAQRPSPPEKLSPHDQLRAQQRPNHLPERTPLNQWKCRKCGHTNRPGAQFCANCGRPRA